MVMCTTSMEPLVKVTFCGRLTHEGGPASLRCSAIQGWVCVPYSRVLAHRNWQIQTAAGNLAVFLHCALETRWQRFGQFVNDL